MLTVEGALEGNLWRANCQTEHIENSLRDLFKQDVFRNAEENDTSHSCLVCHHHASITQIPEGSQGQSQTTLHLFTGSMTSKYGFKGKRAHGAAQILQKEKKKKIVDFEGSLCEGAVTGKATVTVGFFSGNSKVHYSGSWLLNQPHGYGEYSDPESRYDGNFHLGSITGYGTYTCSAFTYTGYFEDNLPHGEGRLKICKSDTFLSDLDYDGSFYRGNFHGRGYVAVGDKTYDGMWKYGYMDGAGLLKIHDYELRVQCCEGSVERDFQDTLYRKLNGSNLWFPCRLKATASQKSVMDLSAEEVLYVQSTVVSPAELLEIKEKFPIQDRLSRTSISVTGMSGCEEVWDGIFDFERTGFGVMRTDGKTVKGYFKQGKICGRGEIIVDTLSDFFSYTGAFEPGKERPLGFGKQTNRQSVVYEGAFDDLPYEEVSRWHGKGTLNFPPQAHIRRYGIQIEGNWNCGCLTFATVRCIVNESAGDTSLVFFCGACYSENLQDMFLSDTLDLSVSRENLPFTPHGFAACTHKMPVDERGHYMGFQGTFEHGHPFAGALIRTTSQEKNWIHKDWKSMTAIRADEKRPEAHSFAACWDMEQLRLTAYKSPWGGACSKNSTRNILSPPQRWVEVRSTVGFSCQNDMFAETLVAPWKCLLDIVLCNSDKNKKMQMQSGSNPWLNEWAFANRKLLGCTGCDRNIFVDERCPSLRKTPGSCSALKRRRSSSPSAFTSLPLPPMKCGAGITSQAKNASPAATGASGPSNGTSPTSPTGQGTRGYWTIQPGQKLQWQQASGQSNGTSPTSATGPSTSPAATGTSGQSNGTSPTSATGPSTSPGRTGLMGLISKASGQPNGVFTGLGPMALGWFTATGASGQSIGASASQQSQNTSTVTPALSPKSKSAKKTPARSAKGGKNAGTIANQDSVYGTRTKTVRAAKKAKTGPTAGQSKGPTAGQSKGPTAGQSKGLTAGQSKGLTAGQSKGPTAGQSNGASATTSGPVTALSWASPPQYSPRTPTYTPQMSPVPSFLNPPPKTDATAFFRVQPLPLKKVPFDPTQATVLNNSRLEPFRWLSIPLSRPRECYTMLPPETSLKIEEMYQWDVQGPKKFCLEAQEGKYDLDLDQHPMKATFQPRGADMRTEDLFLIRHYGQMLRKSAQTIIRFWDSQASESKPEFVEIPWDDGASLETNQVKLAMSRYSPWSEGFYFQNWKVERLTRLQHFRLLDHFLLHMGHVEKSRRGDANVQLLWHGTCNCHDRCLFSPIDSTYQLTYVYRYRQRGPKNDDVAQGHGPAVFEERWKLSWTGALLCV